jgi:hypothetical protein
MGPVDHCKANPAGAVQATLGPTACAHACALAAGAAACAALNSPLNCSPPPPMGSGRRFRRQRDRRPTWATCRLDPARLWRLAGQQAAERAPGGRTERRGGQIAAAGGSRGPRRRARLGRRSLGAACRALARAAAPCPRFPASCPSEMARRGRHELDNS